MHRQTKNEENIASGILRDLKTYLTYLQAMGITELPFEIEKFLRGEEARKDKSTLEDVRKGLGECKRCKLHSKRTNLVFGTGNERARLVFVGEGPGRDEDIQGLPFVGAAGKMLTNIIEKVLNLKRTDVYIANVIKCRPPDNRNPEPDEIATCFPFLERQLEAIKPEVIVTLGNVPSKALLGVKDGITSLRGRFHSYKGDTVIMPTYHPAYLLRNPNKKRETLEDILKVKDRLDQDKC